MAYLMALALGIVLLLTPLPRAWSQGMPPLVTVCGEEPTGAAMPHWVDWDKCRKAYDSVVREQLWKQLQEDIRQQQLQEQQARERWLQEQDRQRLLQLEERQRALEEEAAQAQRDAARAREEQEEMRREINRPPLIFNCGISPFTGFMTCD